MELLGPKFPNIAQENGRLYVLSKHTDFGEDLVYVDGQSWRPWDARRSKVGAAVAKRASQLGIKEGDTVLYLGAAHGYTPTFIADIVGEKGIVYCLDFSATVVRDLLRKCRGRTNMIPILADAKKPETWAYRVTGADAIIMDIAQRDQGAIFLRACERFLKPGGFGFLALKARSVDMTRDPRDIFRDTYRMLEQKVKVVDYRELTPLERDHAVFIIKNEVPLPGAQSAFPEKNNSDGNEARSDGVQSGRERRRNDYREHTRNSAPQSESERGQHSYAPRRDSYSTPRPYGTSKYGNSNNAAPNYNTPRYDVPRANAGYGAPRSDAPRYNSQRSDAPRYDAPRYSSERSDAPRYDAPRSYAPRDYNQNNLDSRDARGSSSQPNSYDRSNINNSGPRADDRERPAQSNRRGPPRWGDRR